MTTSAETFLRKAIPPSMRGPGWDLILGVIGTSEQANWDLAADVEGQLFEATAEGKYLDRRGARSGIRRPAGIGIQDEDFRSLLSVLNASQLTPDAMLGVLEVFYGLDRTHAYSMSGNGETFPIGGTITLLFRFDGKTSVTISLNSNDYPDDATAMEVCASMNRQFMQAGANAIALPWVDQTGNSIFIRVYTGTPGLGGSVECLGGTGQATFSFINEVTGVGGSMDVTRNGTRTRFWMNQSGASNLGLVQVGDDVQISGFADANNGEFTVTDMFRTAAQNLQPNGTFESFTGSFADGWTYQNNNQAGGEAITGAGGTPHSGSFSQQITWSSPSTGLKGIRTLGGDLYGIPRGWQAGHIYLVSFWARAVGTFTGAAVTLNWNTAPAQMTAIGSTTLFDTYHQYQFKVVWNPGQPVESLVPGGLLISLVGTGYSGYVQFDDVTVVDSGLWVEVENPNGVAQSAVSTGQLIFLRPQRFLLQEQANPAYVEQVGLSKINVILPATAGVVTRQPGEATYLRAPQQLQLSAASISGDRQVMTITCSGAHGLNAGQHVILDGLIPASGSACGGAVNGLFKLLTNIAGTGFTVKPPDGPIANLVSLANFISQAGGSATSNAALAPDGTVTASRVNYDGSGSAGSWRATWSKSIASVNGANYLYGIWLRADAPIQLLLGNAWQGYLTCNITSQWQYFSFTAAAQSTARDEVSILGMPSDNTPFVVYAWGPVSAMPTTLSVTSASAMPVPAPTTTDTIDAIIYDPVAGLRVTETTAQTTAALDQGRGYEFLNVADSTPFPDQPGWLVLGLGYSYQAGPVRYYGRAGGGQLILDPSYKLPVSIPSGTTVNLLTGDVPGEPSQPQAGAFYLTSSPAGRIAAEDIIENIAAAGVGAHLTIEYPGDRGLAGEGLPTSGQARLNGVVDCFAGDTVDEEVASLRTAI